MSTHKLTVSACLLQEGPLVDCFFDVGSLSTAARVKSLSFRNVEIRADLRDSDSTVLSPHLIFTVSGISAEIALHGRLYFSAEPVVGGPNDGFSEVYELMVGLGVGV